MHKFSCTYSLACYISILCRPILYSYWLKFCFADWRKTYCTEYVSSGYVVRWFHFKPPRSRWAKDKSYTQGWHCVQRYMRNNNMHPSDKSILRCYDPQCIMVPLTSTDSPLREIVCRLAYSSGCQAKEFANYVKRTWKVNNLNKEGVTSSGITSLVIT